MGGARQAAIGTSFVLELIVYLPASTSAREQCYLDAATRVSAKRERVLPCVGPKSSARLGSSLKAARSLARTKGCELLASKRGHANRILGILVGASLVLDDGRVAGGCVLLEAAQLTCPAHLRLTAPRHVDEATAQFVFEENASVDVELAVARAVEDVDIVWRPQRPPVGSSMCAQVVVERVRASDADSPIGEL